MNKDEFVEYLNKLGINIEESKLNELQRYYELLIEKNKVMNLTNITEEKDVYLKHFYDSLTLVLVCDFTRVESLCDIGTGAGFPGLVLKIIFPHLKVCLIDSLDKRIRFLKEVIDELNLREVEALHTRVEEYAKGHREMFDIVTSRAVARLSVLNELCLPLVKVNGHFISMKGHIGEEIEGAKKSLVTLNSEIEEIKSFNLPFDTGERALIKIIKHQSTDKKYPREFKEIKRKPL